MMEFGACGRCKLEISPERKALSPVVCNHCGFSGTESSDKIQQKIEKNVIFAMLTISAIVLAGFIQILNWDNHSLEIIPLKAQEIAGTIDQQGRERIAQMCMDVKKWSCVESEYAAIGAKDPSQLARLGKFQMKRAEYNQAAQSFYAFFKSGGQDLEASYNYAQALSELGRVDDAAQYFQQVIAARPDVVQVTVVQNYVKLLMEHQRYDQARKLIETVRGESASSNMFMESEFQKLKQLTTASRT